MKLLTYNSKKYLWLSLVLVVISVPVSFFLLSSVFIKSADKALADQAAYTSNHLNEIKTPDDLNLWKKLDSDIGVTLFDKNNFSEEPFTIASLNPETKDFETFRILQKKAEIFGLDHTLAFKVPVIENKVLLKCILLVTLPLLLLIFVGFLLLNKTNNKVWAPFYQIVDSLKNHDSVKNPELTEEELEIDEFNDLKFAVKNLTDKSTVSYQLQKEFTENAAHELQTPVAIIKSKLDLMLQEKGLSGTQSALIDQIYYVLQKLSDLNKNLLFLSKIENQQFNLADNIDCANTVSAGIDSLNFFAEGKYQQLLFPKPAPVFFEGNQSLFEQLVQNLIINAIQYSPKGSLINVLLTTESLTFINEGPQLTFSEEKLFSRFSKTIEKEQKGNGLGLAICKKIAEVHGFDIFYQYVNAKHQFVINFNQKSEV